MAVAKVKVQVGFLLLQATVDRIGVVIVCVYSERVEAFTKKVVRPTSGVGQAKVNDVDQKPLKPLMLFLDRESCEVSVEFCSVNAANQEGP